MLATIIKWFCYKPDCKNDEKIDHNRTQQPIQVIDKLAFPGGFLKVSTKKGQSPYNIQKEL